MLETLHSLGSRIRHSWLLDRWVWLWEGIEPQWQRMFAWLTRRKGFAVCINGDVFKLAYSFGSRYARPDRGSYEPSFYRAFVQSIEEGGVVVDIGAHIGLFTLAAAKRVGAKGRVYAFEPNPRAADILEHHVRLNGWTDRVEIVRAVVSDSNGSIPFYLSGLSMSASVSRENVDVLSPEPHREPARKVRIASVTLDRFCQERNIRPDLLKVDVEGAELLVLRGATKLLLDAELSVFCEVHPDAMPFCQSSLPELTALLDHLGCSLTQLDQPNAMGIFHGHIHRRGSTGPDDLPTVQPVTPKSQRSV